MNSESVKKIIAKMLRKLRPQLTVSVAVPHGK